MSNLDLTYIRSEVKLAVHNPNLSNTRIDMWANWVQDRISREMDADFYKEEFTITCIASQRSYATNCQYAKINQIIDVTNNSELQELSERDLNRSDLDRDSTGTPTHYTIGHNRTYLTQIGTAGVLTIVSSSASDTTQYVQMKGTNSSGHPITESKILNGITNASTTASFTTITDIKLSAVCAGYVTVTDATASPKTLVVIEAGYLQNDYTKLDLYPTPSSTDTLRVIGFRNPKTFVTAYDTPDLPIQWHQLVLIGVIAEAHKDEYELEQAQLVEILFQQGLAKLRSEQGNRRNLKRCIKTRDLKSGTCTLLPLNVPPDGATES